jgi:hypothetical protein
VSANHILQNFLSAENFPEWKWTLKPTVSLSFVMSCVRVMPKATAENKA